MRHSTAQQPQRESWTEAWREAVTVFVGSSRGWSVSLAVLCRRLLLGASRVSPHQVLISLDCLI